MATRVRLKKVPSKRKFIQNLKQGIREEWQDVGEEHVFLRIRWTQGWSADNRPKFKLIGPKNTQRGGYMGVRLTAKSARKAKVSVYTLLDKGTKVRHVKVSPDWQSKTTPGTIVSGPGRGDVIRNNKGEPIIFFNAGPEGIEKRDIDRTINDALLPELRAATRRGLRRARQLWET